MKFSSYCECGNTKERGVEGCNRCRAIDGRRYEEKRQRIIGHRARQSGTCVVGLACDRFLEDRGLVMTTSFKYGRQAR